MVFIFHIENPLFFVNDIRCLVYEEGCSGWGTIQKGSHLHCLHASRKNRPKFNNNKDFLSKIE